MNVVHLIYMHYLFVLDRHNMRPVLLEKIKQKGASKLWQKTQGIEEGYSIKMYRVEMERSIR